MVSSPLNAEIAASQISQKDLVQFKQQMDGLKKRLANSPGTEKKLQEACKNFEAVFISKIWKEMQKTIPKGGVFGSKQSEMYMSMFDRDFAEKMADSGGIGLGDMLYTQLKNKLKQSSRDSLTGKVDVHSLHSDNEGIALTATNAAAHSLKKNPLGNRTLESWLSSEKGPEKEPEQTAVEEPVTVAASAGMNDMEVKARLDALTRRIEKRRSASLTGSASYEAMSVDDEEKSVGKKIARIG